MTITKAKMRTKGRIEQRRKVNKGVTNKDVNVNLNKSRKTNLLNRLGESSNTIAGGFSCGGLASQSQKHHLHAIKDIDINYVDIQSLRSLSLTTFTYKDFKGINPVNQDDPMTISIVITNFMVSKVLIDQGSRTNILYWKTFQRLEISPDMIQPHTMDHFLVLQRREQRPGAMWT